MKIHEMEKAKTRFKVIEGGPLEVTGHFRIVDASGDLLEKEGSVFLCRCGHSSNKPFCDGSHKASGFSS